MGLDIYFYKVANVANMPKKVKKNSVSVNDVYEYHRQNMSDKVKKVAKRTLKKLGKLSGDAYNEEYHKVFTKVVPKYTPYTFKYDFMLVGEPKPLADVKEWWDKFIATYYPTEDAYFRKANFIYNYFSKKLDDECCFVTKHDLEDLIDKLQKVIKTPINGSWLLPTCSGFFFGSTDYDEWYVYQCKDALKQFKKLLKGFNEESDRIIVIMSW